MAKTQTVSIPAELRKNVLALSGEKAEQWLADLPGLLVDLESRWSIRVGAAFVNGEYNFVARAAGDDGTPLVIKIAPPRNDDDFLGEIRYLTERDGNGAVRLLRKDVERQAILLERAEPGESLTRVFAQRKPAAVAPAIELLLTIRQPAPQDLTDTILLDDWFAGLRRHGTTSFAASYGEKALAIYDSLSRQTERIGYLHGDFHPDNIVSGDRPPFLVIDPKGIVGHLGYEIAVFLNNFHWWQEDRADVKERLTVAVEQFATAVGIPELELREWAYAQMVLSAWWTFDEMPSRYDNEVAKADIWDV